MDQKEQNKEFATKSIGKLLLKFALPCVATLLISALYNVVDQIFIGNSMGDVGNAATGVTFPILIATCAFAWGIGDGCASYLSICQGKKQTEEASKAIGTGIVLTFLFSILMLIICIVFADPILYRFGASEKSIVLAREYLIIVASFFPAYMLQNMISGIVRSDGSPFFSMVATGSGAVLNIIFDAVFIFGCNMGIAGAAWATVIGMLVSLVLNFYYVFFKTKTFKLKIKDYIPNFKAFSPAFVLGISSFITQVSIVIVSLSINNVLVKYGNLSSYGQDIPIGIMAIETKVFTIVVNIAVGLILGGQPIIGYNIGAQNIDRVKKTYFLILKWVLGITLAFTILFVAYPQGVVAIFGGSEEAMSYGKLVFRIFLCTIAITSFIKMSGIFFQACGKPAQAALICLSRDILFFLPALFIIPMVAENKQAGSGITALLYAPMVSDILGLIVTVVLTIILFRQLDHIKPKDQDIVKTEEADAVVYPTKPGFVITIGREHGTQGKTIGKMVAEELGIPCYNKELLALAAEESGLSADYLANATLPKQAIFQNLYLSKDVGEEAVIAQGRVIREVASKGSCVIVGRAADYVLKDNPNLISVFIYAPTEYRKQNIMEMYHDDEVTAEKRMRESDRAREEFYHSISGETWNDFTHYDLALDASLGKAKVRSLILDYVHEKEQKIEKEEKPA